MQKLFRFLSFAALITSLASCGGGGTTAGTGGSGIGGTGVTLVRGNVATVTAALEREGREGYARMLARVAELVSSEAIAQAGSVSGIQVSGGGKQDVTDDLGRFELVDVAPDANFILTLVLTDGQRIDFGIGSVPDMSAVEVRNIVVNTTQGEAKPASVEVRDNSDDDSGDNESADDGDSVDDNSEAPDDDSTSPDEPDSDSTDEVEPPESEDGDSTGSI